MLDVVLIEGEVKSLHGAQSDSRQLQVRKLSVFMLNCSELNIPASDGDRQSSSLTATPLLLRSSLLQRRVFSQ